MSTRRARAYSRRDVVRGALALAASSALPWRARAQQPAYSATPALFVSHGSPLLAADPVRGPELRALGATLPKPNGVVAITPHYRTRRIELGMIGEGRAGYTFPAWLARSLPPDLRYATPSNAALAARVTDLLAGHYRVARGDHQVLNHTVWMPLYHLLPSAEVPVLELAHPYLPPRQLLELGRALAPLRDEGVLVLSSGGATHNLGAMDMHAARDAAVPAWAREFDAWLAETVTRSDVDALLDYRARAPAVELAHPDDGDHFDVLLVALGAALGQGSALAHVASAVNGFEAGSMSKRCFTLG